MVQQVTHPGPYDSQGHLHGGHSLIRSWEPQRTAACVRKLGLGTLVLGLGDSLPGRSRNLLSQSTQLLRVMRPQLGREVQDLSTEERACHH